MGLWLSSLVISIWNPSLQPGMTWYACLRMVWDCTHLFGHGQGILNEVWKHKLIFVETPDANETSIALENYRRVRESFRKVSYSLFLSSNRLVIMVAGPFFYRLQEERFRKESILIIIMAARSSCLGSFLSSFTIHYFLNNER
jgi:hypothetical protein